jgi:hypothetical protein
MEVLEVIRQQGLLAITGICTCSDNCFSSIGVKAVILRLNQLIIIFRWNSKI